MTERVRFTNGNTKSPIGRILQILPMGDFVLPQTYMYMVQQNNKFLDVSKQLKFSIFGKKVGNSSYLMSNDHALCKNVIIIIIKYDLIKK